MRFDSLKHHVVPVNQITADPRCWGNDGFINTADILHTDHAVNIIIRDVHPAIRPQMRVNINKFNIVYGQSTVYAIKILVHENTSFKSLRRFPPAIASLSLRGISL